MTGAVLTAFLTGVFVIVIGVPAALLLGWAVLDAAMGGLDAPEDAEATE